MVLGDHNKDMLDRLGQTADLVIGPNGNASGALKRECEVIVTGTPVTAGDGIFNMSLDVAIDGPITNTTF